METVEANDLRLRRLSLIDFASEDDFLLTSSSDLRDVISLGLVEGVEELANVEQLDAVESCRIEERTDTLERRDQDPQLVPSLEPEKTKRNGKYNLRKSLAWDSAFFTSAGVLDPDEISSMIEPLNKNEKHLLPRISEDIQKSSDSISTLESEIMPLECIEGNLFEDVRASIQKSSRNGEVKSRSKAEVGRQEAHKPPFSRKFDLTSQNKMKDKSASKKLTDGLQGPVRIIKQSSSHPHSRQVVSKLPSNSLLSTKRPSLGHKSPLVGNESTKTAGGKLSQMSTSAKKEQQKSLGISVVSSDIAKSSFNSVRRKAEGKVSPSPSSTHKAPSRIASKVTAVGKSHISSYLKSSSKSSSGISPASSISEWSTESSSSSTLDLRCNSSRASLHSISGKRFSVDRDAVGPHTQMTGLLAQSVKKATIQSSVLPTASTKPSGLRLPSPKIGYFDGAKTSSTKSDLVVSGSSTKIGANVNVCEGQNKTKSAKLPPARLLVKGTNHGTQLNSSKTSLKSQKPSAKKMSKTNDLHQNTKRFDSEGSCAESEQDSRSLSEKLNHVKEAGCSTVYDITTGIDGDSEKASEKSFNSNVDGML